MAEVENPIATLDIESDIPGLDLTDVRADFQDIWQKNITKVQQWRQSVAESGNYGQEGEANEFSISKEIYLNIQGSSSNSYTREKYGIDTTPGTWHCFARHDEDLKNEDRIVWNEERFIITNLNQGTYAGERVFWEFDLKAVDKNKASFYD